ncbi:MAG: IPTL-CTERM sorting domain-containing protein, partial [Casimicrobiaceae bacterium]
QGNVLALTSITLGTGATLQGRALARNGTVTLDTNTITACSGGTAGPAPGFIVPPVAAVPPIVILGGPANIPTLSQWATIALTLLLALGGFAALRRRKH